MYDDRLIISDLAALQHILNSHKFVRVPTRWKMDILVFGERSVYIYNVYCAEGIAKQTRKFKFNSHLLLTATKYKLNRIIH
jgi:hypothetical protein